MPLMVAVMARSSSAWGVAGGGGGALAAEEFDLDEGHGVDVGVAQADGVLEDGVGLEQRGLAGDRRGPCGG